MMIKRKDNYKENNKEKEWERERKEERNKTWKCMILNLSLKLE